jgi:hypothetical protein
MPVPSNPLWLEHPNNILWRVRIYYRTKTFIVQPERKSSARRSDMAFSRCTRANVISSKNRPRPLPSTSFAIRNM